MKSLIGTASALMVVCLNSCGVGESKGYLTEHSECKPIQIELDADQPNAAFEKMIGTPSEEPRLAQDVVFAGRGELWGAALFLQADDLPSAGLKVQITESGGDGGPGGAKKAEGEIKRSEILGTPSWVKVRFDELFLTESSSRFWIQIAPSYASSEINLVALGTESGENLHSYSVVQRGWKPVEGKQGLVKLISCQ